MNTSNYLKKLDNIPCRTCCFCVFVIASAVTVPAWLTKEDTTKLNSANVNSIFGTCGLLRCLRVFLFCHKELINASVKVRCSLGNENLKLKAKRNSKQAAKIFSWDMPHSRVLCYSTTAVPHSTLKFTYSLNM